MPTPGDAADTPVAMSTALTETLCAGHYLSATVITERHGAGFLHLGQQKNMRLSAWYILLNIMPEKGQIPHLHLSRQNRNFGDRRSLQATFNDD